MVVARGLLMMVARVQMADHVLDAGHGPLLVVTVAVNVALMDASVVSASDARLNVPLVAGVRGGGVARGDLVVAVHWLGVAVVAGDVVTVDGLGVGLLRVGRVGLGWVPVLSVMVIEHEDYNQRLSLISISNRKSYAELKRFKSA